MANYIDREHIKCSACNDWASPYLSFTEEGQRWAFCKECAGDYEPELTPKDLGAHIMAQYTWRNRIALKWHDIRMKTSRKYRDKQVRFELELTSYLKGVK